MYIYIYICIFSLKVLLVISLCRIAVIPSKTASAKPLTAKALVEHRPARTRTRLHLYYGEPWLLGCVTLPEVCQHVGMSYHHHEGLLRPETPLRSHQFQSWALNCCLFLNRKSFLTVSLENSFLDLEGHFSITSVENKQDGLASATKLSRSL